MGAGVVFQTTSETAAGSCNRCGRPMPGSSAYDGACACGGLITTNLGCMGGAHFSEDRRYRYVLWRTWERKGPYVGFIGLNPSTADERVNDPTVRRCLGYAAAWGASGIAVCNVFALRETHPERLFKQADAGLNVVGPDNDVALINMSGQVDLLIAAWSGHARRYGREAEVLDLLEGRQLHVLGLTQAGAPKHPLYLPARLRPTPWR